MMNRQTSIAYIDLLTVLVALFVITTAILLSQNHEISKGNITNKAEFLAILEWQDNSTSDLDLWLSNPNGNILYFKKKDVGLMTLDRDDTGTNDNKIITNTGMTVVDPIRREQAAIRGIMPGKHVVNVMLYAIRDRPPIVAKIQVIKLNPYKVISERTLQFNNVGEEQTAVSFNVEPNGYVDNIDETTQYNLSKDTIH